ncbi:MAG: toll/interleukin-1 receptor domain-containing protein [Chloroflexi bacterium]|nr:MAG: toll/interleukin-1 receptor domain-containing protein [Chloroflexota bacterium]
MRLFISYAHKDDQFTNWLAGALGQAGFSVWIDREDIRGGDNWMQAIVQGINGCDTFIVVLSPNSIASRHVKIEISLAFQAEKKIVPARLQAYTLPDDLKYQLSGVQYVDFSTGNYQEALNQLVNTLHGKSSPGHSISEQRHQLEEQYTVSPGYFHPVGRWQVQLQFMQFMSSGEFVFMPSGLFTGQLYTPQGIAQMQGGWTLAQGYLTFQGSWVNVAMPGAVMPYGFVLQITIADANIFGGFTSAGEQVIFRRLA